MQWTKVNRCLAEGRARFMKRFAAIDSGAACDGWAPVLSAIADGLASAADMAEVRPHLRHCTACRATLKALYDTEPALGALVPAGALVGAAPEPVSGVVMRAYEAVATGLGERLARLHAAVELVTSSKAAAVVVSTAAVAAGGATVAEHAAPALRAPAAAVARPAQHGDEVVAVARARSRARVASPRSWVSAPASGGPLRAGSDAAPTSLAAATTPARRASRRAAVAKRERLDAPVRRSADFTFESANVPTSSHRVSAPAASRTGRAPQAPARAAEPAGDYGSGSADYGAEFAFEG